MTDAEKCGNCRWWGERGSTEERRPCMFPLPKWLAGGWVTTAENYLSCPVWQVRLPGEDA
jgi:hypothetical protein